jgi:hypothetical protein
VDTRELGNEGWLVYLALHAGKHKGQQLGWKGKQWGVIGGERFQRRACHAVDLTDRQRARFQRVMRRVLGSRRRLPKENSWVRCIRSEVVEKVLAWVLCPVRPETSGTTSFQLAVAARSVAAS